MENNRFINFVIDYYKLLDTIKNDEEFRKSYICEKSKFFKKKYDLPKEELTRTVANYSNNISRIKEIRRPLLDQLIYVAMEFIEFEQFAEKCLFYDPSVFGIDFSYSDDKYSLSFKDSDLPITINLNIRTTNIVMPIYDTKSPILSMFDTDDEYIEEKKQKKVELVEIVIMRNYGEEIDTVYKFINNSNVALKTDFDIAIFDRVIKSITRVIYNLFIYICNNNLTEGIMQMYNINLEEDVIKNGYLWLCKCK